MSGAWILFQNASSHSCFRFLFMTSKRQTAGHKMTASSHGRVFGVSDMEF